MFLLENQYFEKTLVVTVFEKIWHVIITKTQGKVFSCYEVRTVAGWLWSSADYGSIYG